MYGDAIRDELKEKFKNVSLLKFYKYYLTRNKYSWLHYTHALFGSMNLYKYKSLKLISRIKFTKAIYQLSVKSFEYFKTIYHLIFTFSKIFIISVITTLEVLND